MGLAPFGFVLILRKRKAAVNADAPGFRRQGLCKVSVDESFDKLRTNVCVLSVRGEPVEPHPATPTSENEKALFRRLTGQSPSA
jgi:hypothetical protein